MKWGRSGLWKRSREAGCHYDAALPLASGDACTLSSRCRLHHALITSLEVGKGQRVGRRI